ncbi:LLM class oxidoreductase [Pseudomonas sp. SZMC_28357]|uniref:LLM class oxidoreductase n=1 Tax=Pseudomonas sp. SZMC_28357 TaxID=3074380 RepID=UPI002872026B|nr:LLM class oxidoreductase [Pseudomonas sp. SZMC_28357]MDR9754945.1 LLM class oxidoreductase [Pseudomonas sp. SZMC_28357]
MQDFKEHRGYSAMYREGHLTLGLFFAIESYSGAVPQMDIAQQISTAQMAERYGFSALYFRDVFLNVPSFGDVGHIHDPWVFMGYVAAQTSRIALATGSIVSTLRHPLHLAKSAASVDRLSGQRLVLGLATGDRPSEFSAFNTAIETRQESFAEALAVMRRVWSEDSPRISTPRVEMSGADLLPKPLLGNIPVMVTGHSRQSLEWIAQHADGWLYYPQDVVQQAVTIRNWRSMTEGFKPFSQSLYIDLSADPAEQPTPIQLGFRSGHRFLIHYLQSLREIGVNHVGLNLKYGRRPAHEVVQELGEFVVPHFATALDAEPTP